ncbi:methylenetetrahydrofolate reductase [Cocleimonas sp. KMM 6892]|uniref:methylenetetrahydrofolate reductase n=1 Tax=unclassified Cocleimonas TaxID=2639732 RepID=UPI002DB90D73|nr:MULTISPECIES: methylenetetrahydrofolate reductase [unclassified Cocleimonas]MEB8433336.1 methylenetetrahydrofolate reductase [Cocleimonas sp. KMM 6892]MEC4716147.1 methylenetetrahydrofolate reductase [Cocleimonas sp. KMM 6895]MEC4745960.1 methylenetetrahydrofolate reductase [Cocleimonas sp. KMM 6896]
MKFSDEPIPGENLSILPGHNSFGRLERILRAGHFTVTSEMAPPDSADPQEVYKQAALFDGVTDAINATDGSGANCHMSSVGVCSLLTRKGYSMVMQISCRDKNRIAIQGDVLGASAMGVANMLCLTGDGVQAGDHPEAKPVFDLDAMTLLQTIKIMRDEKRFLSGRKLDTPPHSFLGAVANPFAEPREFRVDRLAKKIEAGAQFIQTQYCFDIPVFKEYMARAGDKGLLDKVFILAGVGPMASARSATWIRDNVPGIHIPDWVIKRLKDAENPKQEGQQICIELMQQLKQIEGVAGVHVMAYRQESSVKDIVLKSGVLGDRIPWHPDQAE